MKTRQRGFTLWELLMTLLVAGIVFGIGVPNVLEFQRNGLMTGAANDLVTSVLAARTEAVKRQMPVTLCLSDDPTVTDPVCQPAGVGNSTRGFFVFVDDDGDVDANNLPINEATDGNATRDANELILRRGTIQPGTIQVSANCGYITFGPTGTPVQAPGRCFPVVDDVSSPWHAFLFCDDRGRRIAVGGLSAARLVRVDRFGRGQVLQELAGADGTGITTTMGDTLSAVAPTCPP